MIRDLSEKLESEILELPEEQRKKYKASQVKEKFGQLRVYLTAGTDKMYDLIDRAEDRSGTICEFCGKDGKIRGQGWLYTSCNNCAKPEDKD